MVWAGSAWVPASMDLFYELELLVFTEVLISGKSCSSTTDSTLSIGIRSLYLGLLE
jgi:hypothetical protein